MDIKDSLKRFVYFFIIFGILTLILFIYQTMNGNKEAFDEPKHIRENQPGFYTEAQARGRNNDLNNELKRISKALIGLYVTFGVLMAIPIFGWVGAAVTMGVIAGLLIDQAILRGKFVNTGDPIGINDANKEIGAIQEDIKLQKKRLRQIQSLFKLLKHTFTGNQKHIKTEATRILTKINKFIELIEVLYKDHLTNTDIPMVNLYKECKDLQINLTIISDDNMIKKSEDVKSSDIDLSSLNLGYLRYYQDQNNIPPSDGDTKSDIINYVIVVTKTIKKELTDVRLLIDEHFKKNPEYKSQKDKNKKNLNRILDKIRKMLNKLDDHIDSMIVNIEGPTKKEPKKEEVKNELGSNAFGSNAFGSINVSASTKEIGYIPLFEEIDRINAIIREDENLIKRLDKYKETHFL